MPIIFHPLTSCDLGTFAIYIASSDQLRQAVSGLAVRYPGSILCIHGGGVVTFQGIEAGNQDIRIRQVTHPEEMLVILGRDPGSLTIIEHDSSWYDTHADMIIPLGQAFRTRSRVMGTVILIAPRYDTWIKRFEHEAHQLVYHGTPNGGGSNIQHSPPPGQMRLVGI